MTPAALSAASSSCWLLACVLVGHGGAIEPGAPDAAGSGPNAYAPEAVSHEDFANLTESSPFTRPLNLADTLVLAGLVKIDGRPIATLINQETKQVHLVSDEPNERGWRIVEISADGDLENLSATISVSGSEVTTLQFDPARLKPTNEQVLAGARIQDTRPKPTDEERRKFGELVRDRMSKMSEEQRRQVGQIMQEKSKGNPGLTDRQKGELFIKVLDHVGREGRKR